MKIKEHFLANQNATDLVIIQEQIQCANETSEFLMQGVLQGEFNPNDNLYKVKITEHTKLHDNTPLKEGHKIDLDKFEIPERFKKS